MYLFELLWLLCFGLAFLAFASCFVCMLELSLDVFTLLCFVSSSRSAVNDLPSAPNGYFGGAREVAGLGCRSV